MSGGTAVTAIQLHGGKAGILPQLQGGHLIRGNAIGHVLAGNGIAIGAGQPKGTAPVCFIAILVGAALHYREILLMPSQRGKPFRQFVVRPGVIQVGKPSLLRYPKAYTQKDGTLWRRGFCLLCGDCKWTESD